MASLKLTAVFAIVAATAFTFVLSQTTTTTTRAPPRRPPHWLVVYSEELFVGRSRNYTNPLPGVIIPEFPVKSFRWHSRPNDGFCETLCRDELQIQYNCSSRVGANLTATPANKILIWSTSTRLYCETSKNFDLGIPVSGLKFTDEVVTQAEPFELD